MAYNDQSTEAEAGLESDEENESEPETEGLPSLPEYQAATYQEKLAREAEAEAASTNRPPTAEELPDQATVGRLQQLADARQKIQGAAQKVQQVKKVVTWVKWRWPIIAAVAPWVIGGISIVVVVVVFIYFINSQCQKTLVNAGIALGEGLGNEYAGLFGDLCVMFGGEIATRETGGSSQTTDSPSPTTTPPPAGGNGWPLANILADQINDANQALRNVRDALAVSNLSGHVTSISDDDLFPRPQNNFTPTCTPWDPNETFGNDSHCVHTGPPVGSISAHYGGTLHTVQPPDNPTDPNDPNFVRKHKPNFSCAMDLQVTGSTTYVELQNFLNNYTPALALVICEDSAGNQLGSCASGVHHLHASVPGCGTQ